MLTLIVTSNQLLTNDIPGNWEAGRLVRKGLNVLEVRSIFDSEAEHLLKEMEGQRLDFKSKRISPAKISKTIAAFANTDGGEIYIGIEDNGIWDGFVSIEEANSINDIISRMFPTGEFIGLDFLKAPSYSGLVLKVEIGRTTDIKRNTAGEVYLRYGAQDLIKKDLDSIRKIEYTKGINSYEDMRVNLALDDVENSKSILGFSLNIVPHPEPKDWLRKQKLVVDEAATVAAAILFCDEPQVYIPKSGIKIYRYKTIAVDGTRDTLAFDPITIEGSAVELINGAVLETISKTQDIPKLGDHGLQQILYPKEAIHEVITNAIIHRDYSINDECHIRIFDNRIEVFSPGKLPGHVTESNILKERFARNPKIVRILNKFPDAPNKDIGEGLNTTFEKMRELKLKDPRIQEGQNGVTVFLYHELLASPEEIIELYLKSGNAEINNSKARELCREGSENKMKRVLERMMDANIIERIPDRKGRATAYRLVN